MSVLENGPKSEVGPDQTAELQARPAPEDVIAQRQGDVLIKHTLLKADHFPGCQNTKLRPLLDGAPNFRQVDGLPVYGVAIPTVRGLRNVLDHLGAAHGQRRVLWHNMREEPVIYINGQPYVVREADQPFCNLEYTGIDRSRVEDMERRLKADVLEEGARFDGYILVSGEDDDMQVLDMWEPVTESDVQTPLEVYEELVRDGYDVDYLRVPITDEKAPKDHDFELLVQRLWIVPPGAALVFNCQMGRGRTTTGMIIASMLWLRRLRAFPLSRTDGGALPPAPLAAADGANGAHAPAANGTSAAAAAARGAMLGSEYDVVPRWFERSNIAAAAAGAPVPAPTDRHKAGLYNVIRSLLRVLESGTLGKAVADSVIDACSAMQNLREAIGSYRQRMLAEQKERRRATLMAVCLEYLERYYMLVAFASFLSWSKFDPTSPGHVSFQDWTNSRPELRSVLSRMLRRNPLTALELHVPAATLGAAPPSDDLALTQAEDQADRIIEQRNGAVLGPLTLLKEDYFPGMKSRRVPQTLPGASNFRVMSGRRIYGVAMSTLSGIRNVLRAVVEREGPSGRAPGSSGAFDPRSTCQPILWFNMREEPVVYINGRPFVLREQARPLKNLQEYAGIDAARLERMELRLKDDVLAEAARCGGRILVARETANSSVGSGELVDTWEDAGPGAVQTPAEVYAQLRAKEGYQVTYARVPVTDGRAPSPEDMDVILALVREAGYNAPVVFNCQLGAGRTTTGMVIAGLLHCHAEARTLSRISSSLLHMEEMGLKQLQEELAGGSPKSEDDERDERMFGGQDVWSMSAEEIEEQRSLAAGGYVGVRRVVRLLEEGEAAKRIVDGVIDANAQLLNLRTNIMRYRKPRNSYKNHKSEVRARHAAFARGAAYLERYCLLVAFAAFLDAHGSKCDATASFAAWLASRPDLQQALGSIHSNPAAALAAIPAERAAPVVYSLVASTVGGVVTPEEQQHVLSKRRGRTLTRRIILKSYASVQLPHGSTDVRQADGLPIFTVGNATVSGLRRLLQHLGAGPGGSTHVVLTDVREELVVYVNGVPFIRRELEMPAAAMHHAGVQWRQLEALEQALKEDVLQEAAKWGGRVLLHHELQGGAAAAAAAGVPLVLASGAAGAVARAAPGGDSVAVSLESVLEAAASGASFLTPAGEPLSHALRELLGSSAGDSALGSGPGLSALLAARAGAGLVPPANGTGAGTANGVGGATTGVGAAGDGATGAATAGAQACDAAAPLNGSAEATPRGFTAPPQLRILTAAAEPPPPAAADLAAALQRARDDVTGPVDYRPGAAVAPFWEAVDVEAAAPGSGDAACARRVLATCRDVAMMLAAEGFRLTYRRIPLSRERTPMPGDVLDLHSQALVRPGGGDGGGADAPTVVRLVLARTATGSSARFAAAALATHALGGRPTASAGGAPSAARVSSASCGSGPSPGPASPHVAAASSPRAPPASAGTPASASTPGSPQSDAKRLKRTLSELGEYRGIMSVVRLLPAGLDIKAIVDEAIDRCHLIGNLRDDIRACKRLAEAGAAGQADPLSTTAWAARQLGVHYLRRYFLLIVFKNFLLSGGDGASGDSGFVRWMEERKELGHMLNHLTLDT